MDLTLEQKEQLKTAIRNQLAGFSADTEDTQVFRQVLGMLGEEQ